MPKIARTSDVIARVVADIATEAQPAVSAAEVTALVASVDTRGKGTLSQAEVRAIAAQNQVAGEHVAKAYQLITGRRVAIGPVVQPASTSLAAQIPPAWRKLLADEVKKPYFAALEKFLGDERKSHNILPPASEVFAALARTPPQNVKVVLLGQDPYPTAGNADGLSFSVDKGMPIPASLKNMLETAHADVGTKVPNNGDLTPWADQGVLLLNTVLTVREGQPDSHKDHGWEQFTQAILDKVNQEQKRVVFLLLGKQAQAEASHVDTSKHVVLNEPHPSPMNPGNPFGKTRPFSAVNDALKAGGRPAIDWQIPDA